MRRSVTGALVLLPAGTFVPGLEGGMGVPAFGAAVTDTDPSDSHPAMTGMYLALVAAGFRRYAAYRQAMVAAAFTNSVFGFLRTFAILAATVGAGGVAAGYDRHRAATFVWAGQGLLGTVLLWFQSEMTQRIRTGDVVIDLLRPVDPVWRELAGDIGRAGFGMMTRFVVPMTVGAIAFDLYVPRRVATYPLFGLSVLLAVVVCSACRYLEALAAYWLMDSRGPHIMWVVATTGLSGIAFPLWYLPDWASAALVYGTPVPSIVQVPLDILVERNPAAGQLRMLALQAGWAVIMLSLCRLVQRRAEHRLEIQGG